ncbi:hypothetical protein [Streptomyces sp. NBC_00470]|uniref:hypothetical protein n=1 Tax=Streptomyces sp. NBC_00470 TaxID=2975753 RepID=UPI0030E4DB6C
MHGPGIRPGWKEVRGEQSRREAGELGSHAQDSSVLSARSHAAVRKADQWLRMSRIEWTADTDSPASLDFYAVLGVAPGRTAKSSACHDEVWPSC